MSNANKPMFSSLTLPPLSLYIHIPWCVRKCPYCDFNSHVSNEKNTLDEPRYIEALKRDIDAEKKWRQGRKLQSIFFGGGTPSLFSADSIADILAYAEKNLGFASDIEITLEANPGTFEQEKFSGFYQAGVNRLSIGIQSFNPQHLQTLGRIHNSDEAKRAVGIAQQAGFNNINLDLMHGLPQQTIDNANDDLQTAIDFAPQHISWYQLTIEPNTQFYRQPPPLPADDTLADIQYHGSQLLATNGFQQYEISAFSQAGQQSTHNRHYWEFGDYIGIGAGAHGKFTDIDQQRIIRRQKTRLPEHYLDYQQYPKAKETIVDTNELALEFMMNALRLTEGVPIDYFSQRTGLSVDSIKAPLQQLHQQGLLDAHTEKLTTTEFGQRFLNTVLEKFNTDIS
ncbi:MAG: putative oxygen-independent coproporphyrinogen III oxidase [Kiritimatiellia bacterium]|jgi:putative oxygen-independent coproporphyrinogen III oxidase